MSERYKVISDTDHSDILYRGFPVILQKSRVTYDNQSGKVIIQAKLCNVSDETVDTVYLAVNAFDVTGQLICSVDEHIMSMLDAAHGQSFGDKSPVYADDSRIASVSIVIKKVVFKSGGVWENAGNETGEKAEPAKAIDFSSDIRAQFNREAGADIKSANRFEEYETYWRCSCGMLNGSENIKCVLCGADTEKLRKCFDTEYLAVRYEEYETARKNDIYDNALRLSESNTPDELETAIKKFGSIRGWKDADSKIVEVQTRLDEVKEARRRAEQKAREEAAEAAKKLRTKKDLKILAVVLPILLIVCVVQFVIPSVQSKIEYANKEKQYSEAENMFANGQYDEAAAAFATLKGFKDSENKIHEIDCTKKYNNAELLLNDGKYYEAITAFKEIADFDDAKEKIDYAENCILSEKYNTAEKFVSNGDYDKALSIYNELAASDFSDSAEKIKEIKYRKADKYCNDENVYSALLIFEELSKSNYKDSADRYEEMCDELYNSAMSKYNEGKYSRAINEFQKLGDYKDSAEYVNRSVWENMFSNFKDGKKYELQSYSSSDVITLYISVTPKKDGLKLDFTDSSNSCTLSARCAIYKDNRNITISASYDTGYTVETGKTTIDIEEIKGIQSWSKKTYKWTGVSSSTVESLISYPTTGMLAAFRETIESLGISDDVLISTYD